MDLPHITYLIGILVFALIWLFMFAARPDLWPHMLMMGLIVGVLAFVGGWLWFTYDWWHPLTITGTRVGIEDLLLGFTNGGIAIAIYEILFRRRFASRPGHRHSLGFILLWTICLLTIAVCFWIFGMTSFWSFIVAAVVIAISETILRPDLFYQAVITGLLMMIIILPFYYAMMAIEPGWVDQTYHLTHLTRIMIGGIPLEEFAFYFFLGFTLAPGYEYWQNLQARKLRIR